MLSIESARPTSATGTDLVKSDVRHDRVIDLATAPRGKCTKMYRESSRWFHSSAELSAATQSEASKRVRSGTTSTSLPMTPHSTTSPSSCEYDARYPATKGVSAHSWAS
eukprot:6197913-Pleurochrysis_carterae.AAC.3